MNFAVMPLENFDWNALSQSQRRSGNELFFVTAGHLVRNCNFKPIRLNKNDFHFSQARQISSVSEHSPDVKGYYCLFEDNFWEHAYTKEGVLKELEFISSFLFQYPVRLNLEVGERLEQNLSHLVKLQKEADPDTSLSQIYLIAIIFEIKRILVQSHLNLYPSKSFLIAKQYNDLLAAYVTQERSLIFYARKLSITPNHLNKSVKAVTGRTAVALLNETTVLEAKYRLETSSHSVNEIAFQLGFEDQSYFSRFFKNATGYSPSEYRKNLEHI